LEEEGGERDLILFYSGDNNKLYKTLSSAKCMEKIENKTTKFVDAVKYNVVDSTGMMIESNPLFSAVEVGLVHYTDMASINARIFFTASAYLGVGFLYGKGRDVSRKIFKVTDQTKEWKQHTHDILYTAAFNLVVAVPIYAASQAVAGEEIDMTKVFVGSGLSTVIGALNGSPMGYFVDVVRDLTGMRECKRKSYPVFLKEQTPPVKKLILGGLAAASIGLMTAVYSITPNQSQNSNTLPQNKIQMEKTVVLDASVQNKSLEKLTNAYYYDFMH
jgi:hypothetical protein